MRETKSSSASKQELGKFKEKTFSISTEKNVIFESIPHQGSDEVWTQLRKYVSDPSHILGDQPIKVRENLSVDEIPLKIVDQKDQVLRIRTIPYVKVQWTNHTPQEATWKLKKDMRNRYPYLFYQSM